VISSDVSSVPAILMENLCITLRILTKRKEHAGDLQKLLAFLSKTR
jgi:hypothetical protein